MCDYSLHLVASRPARAGERLISTRFGSSITRGFASVDDRTVAVCLRPGTELAFDDDIRRDTGFGFPSMRRLGHNVARFRQVNMNQPNVHHDALELPDGQVVMLTELCEGQLATVLQLPADQRAATEKTEQPEPIAV